MKKILLLLGLGLGLSFFSCKEEVSPSIQSQQQSSQYDVGWIVIKQNNKLGIKGEVWCYGDMYTKTVCNLDTGDAKFEIMIRLSDPNAYRGLVTWYEKPDERKYTSHKWFKVEPQKTTIIE